MCIFVVCVCVIYSTHKSTEILKLQNITSIHSKYHTCIKISIKGGPRNLQPSLNLEFIEDLLINGLK